MCLCCFPIFLSLCTRRLQLAVFVPFSPALRFPRSQCLHEAAEPHTRQGLCLCGWGGRGAPPPVGPTPAPSAAVHRRLQTPPLATRPTRARSQPSAPRRPARGSHSCGAGSQGGGVGCGAAQQGTPSEARELAAPPPPLRELPAHTLIWCCRGRGLSFTPDATSGCHSRGRLPAPGQRGGQHSGCLARGPQGKASMSPAAWLAGRPPPLRTPLSGGRNARAAGGGGGVSEPIRVAQ